MIPKQFIPLRESMEHRAQGKTANSFYDFYDLNGFDDFNDLNIKYW